MSSRLTLSSLALFAFGVLLILTSKPGAEAADSGAGVLGDKPSATAATGDLVT